MGYGTAVVLSRGRYDFSTALSTKGIAYATVYDAVYATVYATVYDAVYATVYATVYDAVYIHTCCCSRPS